MTDPPPAPAAATASAGDLLHARVCDLGLRIEDSPLEPVLRRFREELAARRLGFRPPIYLSDEWGCPDEVPIIAIPFYHADPRLRQIEQERTGALESDDDILRTLRHETGHAFNYAYRLWEGPEWKRLFGDFRAVYRERYTVRPFDDRFVRVLPGWYAQKHPDEDFAETFAAWLDPETDWRERYAGWRAHEKLEYVDRMVAELADAPPVVPPAPPIHPVEEMDVTVEAYYRSRSETLPLPTATFFDDELRAIFEAPDGSGDGRARAADWMAREEDRVVGAVMAHTGEWTPFVGRLWTWLRRRAGTLDLRVDPDEASAALVDLTALVTAAVTHERWRDATAS